MTDITKYKNVSLSHETYGIIDQLRKILVPNTKLSSSQTINILVKELDTLAINIDTAKTATITASEVCYRLINQGMTSTFFVSCYNNSGFNLKTKNSDGSDIIIGVDTCTVEEEPFAKACA